MKQLQKTTHFIIGIISSRTSTTAITVSTAKGEDTVATARTHVYAQST